MDESKTGGKQLRMFDVGEEQQCIKCPKCGSTAHIRKGVRELHPRGSNETQLIPTYQCVSCEHRYSIRPYRGTQYSEAIIKLTLRLQQEMNNSKIAEVVRDVYGLSVTRITVGYWRMKFGSIYAWHKWNKVSPDKFECIYCQQHATARMIRDGRLSPCTVKLNLRTQKEPHERIAKR